MTWEAELVALWEDLEQQAEGLALRQRDADVADLARAEYAEVDLAGRLAASTGHRVEVAVAGLGPVRGRLAGAGAEWCMVVQEHPGGNGDGDAWVVALASVVSFRGLADGSRPAAARPVTSRLGVGSVLRRLAERRAEVLVVDRAGGRRSGTLGRVGADFLELHPADGRVETVPFGAVAALRGR